MLKLSTSPFRSCTVIHTTEDMVLKWLPVRPVNFKRDVSFPAGMNLGYAATDCTKFYSTGKEITSCDPTNNVRG